jgi:outer membrane protein
MNHFRKIVFVVAVLSVALTLGSVAQAQQSPFAIDNVPNIVGVAVGVAPDYWGSDDSQGVGAPFFRWTFEGQERYLQLLATELSLNVLDNANYYFGPVLNYRPGRDDDVDDDVVKKMTEIDGTVELGVMGAYIWRNQANPRHRFIASAQVLGDVGGEYEGWMAMAGVRYWSGLSRFDAGSGFRDINIPVALVFHYSMNWHVAAGFKYFKLLDDASDSPITDLRGSDNQLIAGLGVAYSW